MIPEDYQTLTNYINESINITRRHTHITATLFFCVFVMLIFIIFFFISWFLGLNAESLLALIRKVTDFEYLNWSTISSFLSFFGIPAYYIFPHFYERFLKVFWSLAFPYLIQDRDGIWKDKSIYNRAKEVGH